MWQPHAVSLIINQLLHVGSRQHCKAGRPLLQRHVIQILLSVGPVPVGTQDDVQVKQMHSLSNPVVPFESTTFV